MAAPADAQSQAGAGNDANRTRGRLGPAEQTGAQSVALPGSGADPSESTKAAWPLPVASLQYYTRKRLCSITT